MIQKIKIEVGANTGRDTKRLAVDGSIVYAFEPTKELVAQHLFPLSVDNPNIRVIPFAIDIDNDFKTFNIAGQDDWGCSSLYEFADNIEDKWKGRTDFRKTHSYTVPTITLYDFCNLYKIEFIDFLHIDAQGADFNVLLSLKDKIQFVRAGVIEASAKVDLYKGVNNRIEQIRTYLLSHGFTITKEVPNDVVGAEVNLHFEKRLA